MVGAVGDGGGWAAWAGRTEIDGAGRGGRICGRRTEDGD